MHGGRHPVEFPEGECSALPVPPSRLPSGLWLEHELLGQSSFPLYLGEGEHRACGEVLVQVHPVQKHLQGRYAVERIVLRIQTELYGFRKIEAPVGA